MVFDRGSRTNSGRASSLCSTTTIVVVALCLVGAWMITSTTVTPVDVSTLSADLETKGIVPETNSRSSSDISGSDDPPGGNTGSTEDVVPTNKLDSKPEKEETKIVADDTQKDVPPKEVGSDDASIENKGTEISDQTDDTGKPQESEEAGNDKNLQPEEDIKPEQPDANKGQGDQVSVTGKNDEDKGEDDDKSQGKQVPVTDEIDENKGEEEKPKSKSEDDINQTKDQDKMFPSGAQSELLNETNVKNEMWPTQVAESKNEREVQGSSTNKLLPSGAQSELLNETSVKNEMWPTQVAESKNEREVQGSSTYKSLPSGAQSGLLNETKAKNEMWPTQVAESKNEREVQGSSTPTVQITDSEWKLCNTTAGADYIPCLDNAAALQKIRDTMHYQHRERHCPENPPTCLVPLPDGYKQPIQWPESRDKVRYNNVPHTQLAGYKGHQNWVKVSGEHLVFPGGGTQFIHGALHYIDFIEETLPEVGWGRRSRVILDVGCGVASFGGYIFDRDVLTMSFAPKDEHEAQVQFALERGIPAISAVMGTKRLPFPSKVFDAIHCARCRVPWHIEGGRLLLELNRMLRPGGYFVWSATPAYRESAEDVEIWTAMSELTNSMCWKMAAKRKDEINQAGLAIFIKPTRNDCYKTRAKNNPPLCEETDDPDAAWNISLQACMHKLPEDPASRGAYWPEEWPQRLRVSPYWLNNSQIGIYGKPSREDFKADYEHWKRVVSKSYVNGLGIDWSTVRNVMDMRSVYGGFAAALKDMSVWVMNIVPIHEPDTLPIIYERGLFGMYHNWCESFSTYPRTYDLLHADQLFSKLKNRCDLLPVFVEVDRILRPQGKLIVRDNSEIISEIEKIARSLHWEIRLTYSQGTGGLLCIQKTMWRPTGVAH